MEVILNTRSDKYQQFLYNMYGKTVTVEFHNFSNKQRMSQCLSEVVAGIDCVRNGESCNMFAVPTV